MSLPLELLPLIVQHLEYRQLIQMLRLSKSFNRLLLSLPPLIDTLVPPGAKTFITPVSMNAALDRWTSPKTVMLPTLTDASEKCLENRPKHWQTLQQLEHLEMVSYFGIWCLPVPRYRHLKFVHLRDTAVDTKWLALLLRECTFLERLFADNVIPDDSKAHLSSKSLKILDLCLCKTIIATYEGYPGFVPVITTFIC